MNASPAFIVRPEILHGLGIVRDLARAPIAFADDAGRQSTLELRPVDVLPIRDRVVNLGLVPVAKEQPLYRQKLGVPFWFTYLPESQTTYVNFRRYGSLGDHARQMFAFIDGHRTTRLVIDLRQNGGGDFLQGRKHLIAPIARRADLNQRGRLFVIVGRYTFSAAMANAIDCHERAHRKRAAPFDSRCSLRVPFDSRSLRQRVEWRGVWDEFRNWLVVSG